MRAQSPDFRNVCFPCSTGLSTLLQVSEETYLQSDDSPCHSNRSSASSTASVGKMDSKISPSENELTDRLSLGQIVQNVVLNVAAKAQLRRRNSSLSRTKSSRRTELTNATTSRYIEEWSETFVAQDGVLTTNFCSTEL